MSVLMVVNFGKVEAVQDALMLETWLKRQGLDVLWAPDYRQEEGLAPAAKDHVRPLPGLGADPLPPLTPDMLNTADLVLSLGGDGTLLRAARIVGYREVPILGLSYGHLGFLTAANPADVKILSVVSDALSGELHVSRRATLEATVAYTPDGDGGSGQEESVTLFALNDLALTRGAVGDMIEFDMAVSGHHIDKLRGDGLVVSTATGSTGYALSAGGPIVSPEYKGMVVVPIAPHTIQARAFLTSPADVVEVTMDHDRPARASVQADGRVVEVPGEIERLVVRRGPGDVLLLDYGPESFYASVSRVFYGVRRHDR